MFPAVFPGRRASHAFLWDVRGHNEHKDGGPAQGRRLMIPLL